ncbi:MAG TPA: hypothetical protein VFK54_10875 [Candidatus Limnocylindrales bacterium]|nr:hypothetical protein [Candidatus Limnocylindrales bacterium]
MRTMIRAVAIAATAALVTSAVVIASSSLGVTAVTRADGLVSGRVNVNIPGSVKLQAKDGLHVLDQELTIAPLGHTGWHTHPGPVLVTVKSGTFRYQHADCTFTDYTVGQTIVDPGGGHIHIGRNPSSSVALELSVTYLLPPGAPVRIEADAVACS